MAKEKRDIFWAIEQLRAGYAVTRRSWRQSSRKREWHWRMLNNRDQIGFARKEGGLTCGDYASFGFSADAVEAKDYMIFKSECLSELERWKASALSLSEQVNALRAELRAKGE